MRSGVGLDDDLKMLDIKLKQLKLEYEKYFLGSRPREPEPLRRELQKAVLFHSNNAIQNTALRFKFNSIHSRFQVFKRQWDATLRQIEAGTYKRHVFKAKLHERERGAAPPGAKSGARATRREDLFEAYVGAAEACGQDVKSLTPEKLQRVVAKQEAQLRKKLGCEQVNFRVVVEKGKVKLKASAGE